MTIARIFMKRLLIFMSVCLFSFMCHAQAIQFGIKGGLNISKESTQVYNSETFGTFDYNTYSRYGINIGGLVNIPTGNKFELEVGLSYSMLGYKDKIYDDSNSDGYFYAKITSHYLTIPIAEKFYPFCNGLYIEAGPQFGFLLSKDSSLSGQYAEMSFDGNTKTFDFALLGGLGYRFSNHIFVDARYIHSLSNTSTQYEGGKNRNFQISVGYMF